MLDVWYGFVGANAHLLHYFTNASDGKPNAEYLRRVRQRFEQWVLDTAAAEYDQDWLDYQFEIGRRHHRVGKNRTDGVAAVEHIHYRYLPALIVPVTTTLKPFLAAKGHGPADVERMHAAWVKSVTLQVILWSYPYCRDGCAPAGRSVPRLDGPAAPPSPCGSGGARPWHAGDGSC